MSGPTNATLFQQAVHLGNFPSDPSSGRAGDTYFNTTSNKVKFFNGTIWQFVGSGSGVGGVDFLTNGDFEDGTVYPWATFANTAASTPPNNNTAGTGGSPTATLTINGSTPLSGLYDGIFAKPNSNCQGNGFSQDFPVDRARQGALMQIDFDYVVGGAFTTGANSDLQIFLLDKDAGELLPVDNPFIESSSGHYTSRVQLSNPSSLNFRLIFFIATTNASAWTFEVDNIDFGLPSIQQVASNGDRQVTDFVSLGTGNGTVGNLTFVAQATARYQIIANYVGGPAGGQDSQMDIASVGTSPTQFQEFYGKTYAGSSAYRNTMIATALADLVAGQTYSFNVNVNTSSDNEGGVVWATQVTADQSPVGSSVRTTFSQMLANGTQVTGGPPTAIGQYRALYRQSGTLNDLTDCTGFTAPTTSDGVLMYGNVAYGSTGTASQPTVLQVFVGFNKNFQLQGWASAAHVDPVDLSHWVAGTSEVGPYVAYDPGAGIVTIDFNFQQSTITSRLACGDINPSAYAFEPSVYIDASVSDNPIGVGLGGYVGEVKLLTTNVVPPGALELGQAVSRTTYARLFGICGTNYGIGDGSTTFDLPPRGALPRIWDHGSGNDPDASTRYSNNGGSSGDNVGSFQATQNLYHTHGVAQQDYDYAAGGNLLYGGVISSRNGPTPQTDGSGGNQSNPFNANFMGVIVY